MRDRFKRHKKDLDIVHSPYIKYIVQSKLQNFTFFLQNVYLYDMEAS